MLVTTLIIVTLLLVCFIMMSTEHVHHINRAAVAMCCGVASWVIYMIFGGIAENAITRYIGEACNVILFLIATNTIIEVLHNNGVFDSLITWLRMRNSRLFLWIISVITVLVSANVDNLTSVVLMMSIIGNIVRSSHQRKVYACVVMVAAALGGCCTVIGDMTSLMLWVRGLVTPTDFFLGLLPACLVSLCAFNLLMSHSLYGRVEVVSIFSRHESGESYLANWQKIILLILGIGGLWFIPTFRHLTHLPPFLGALCVLALMWMIEGLFNLERNGNVLLVQRHYFRNTEFIGMRMILYFLGVSLGIGALTECGALDQVGHYLLDNVGNSYVYAMAVGALSTLIDNVPMMMIGMNMFDHASGVDFALNGNYWLLLSYCCSFGGAILFIGTMAGQAVLQVQHINFMWLLRHYAWKVLLAWLVGVVVFWAAN